MTIGAIIQARMSSTRLPGKILKTLPYDSNITALEQVIRRMKRSKQIGEIIIATTTEKEDNEIVKIADKEGVRWFRGSENDLLARYHFALEETELDVIVAVTSDCPCIDAEIVDLVIEKHLSETADFTANWLTRTFPRGLEVEVFSFAALERSFHEAQSDLDKEHIPRYISTTNPGSFRIAQVCAPEELTAPDIRITLDTENDYALLCMLFDHFYSSDPFFFAREIVTLFREKPWLKLINKNSLQKKVFGTLAGEIVEVAKILDFYGLKRAKEFLKEQTK